MSSKESVISEIDSSRSAGATCGMEYMGRSSSDAIGMLSLDESDGVAGPGDDAGRTWMEGIGVLDRESAAVVGGDCGHCISP